MIGSISVDKFCKHSLTWVLSGLEQPSQSLLVYLFTCFICGCFVCICICFMVVVFEAVGPDAKSIVVGARLLLQTQELFYRNFLGLKSLRPPLSHVRVRLLDSFSPFILPELCVLSARVVQATFCCGARQSSCPFKVSSRTKQFSTTEAL